MDAYVLQLIYNLRVFSFVCMAIARMTDNYIYRDGYFMKRVIFCCCLAAMISNYDTILASGTSMFDAMKVEAAQNSESIYANINTALSSYSNSASWFERFVTIPIAVCIIGICQFFAWISSFVQVLFQTVFRVAAPIVLGLSAFRVLQSGGLHFAVATVWLCMWNIGTAIADVLLSKILIAALGKTALTVGGQAASAVASAAASGNIASVGAAILPYIIMGGIVFIVCSVVFYITIPIMLYKIISGGEIVGSAVTAIGSAIGMSAAAGAAFAKNIKEFKGSEKNTAQTQQKDTSSVTVSGMPSTGHTGNTPPASNVYSVMAEAAEKQLSVGGKV